MNSQGTKKKKKSSTTTTPAMPKTNSRSGG